MENFSKIWIHPNHLRITGTEPHSHLGDYVTVIRFNHDLITAHLYEDGSIIYFYGGSIFEPSSIEELNGLIREKFHNYLNK